MSEHIRSIGAADFQSVISGDSAVVVDFYSTDCPPCEAVAPKFEAIAGLYHEKVTFVKIFRQENRELATSLGVASSPTLIFYKDGERTGDFLTGGIKRSDIEKNVRALVNDTEFLSAVESRKVKTQTDAEILILGGGTAGLTAAIYTAQARRKTILVDPALPGGQVGTTHQVSNFPGFEEALPGYMLAHHMHRQAEHAGAEFRSAAEITRIDLAAKEVEIDGLETIRAKKIIVATGASPRPLGIPGEKEYKGRGISYCATCDAKYFDGKDVIVVGGGNSAIEESLFIAKFAKSIRIVHQFATLQANKEAQEKAFAEPKISFLFEHEPRAFVKTATGMDVVVEDLKAKETKTLSADGVFVFIGMKPNLEQFGAVFDLDKWGYIQTDAVKHTNVRDVFAAGDVSEKPFRQITIAAADGTIAAIQAAKELDMA